MSDKLSISIRIGERTYPMFASTGNEAVLRSSAKELTERIKNYKRKYAIKDGEDVLSMVAFDLMVEKHQSFQENKQHEQDIIARIQRLQRLLSERFTPPAEHQEADQESAASAAPASTSTPAPSAADQEGTASVPPASTSTPAPSAADQEAAASVPPASTSAPAPSAADQEAAASVPPASTSAPAPSAADQEATASVPPASTSTPAPAAAD